MNKQVKKEWLAALRSGAYKKGHGQLKNKKDNTYCCLGVLCDIYAKKMKKSYDRVINCKPIITITFSDSITLDGLAFPPKKIVDWANLTSDRLDDLAKINDKGMDFRDVIRKISRDL